MGRIHLSIYIKSTYVNESLCGIYMYTHLHVQLHCVGVPEGGWFAERAAKESHQEALLR